MDSHKFGIYKIKEKLGEGAMGQIYRAYHEHLQMDVAIKIPSNIKSELDIKRFRREAEVMAKLSHPSIVKIYDVGVINNYPYIAMELIKGLTLEQVLLENSLHKKKIIDIIIKIAHGLNYAHSQKVIHRDIKPENIMVVDNEPKIMDFGLAKFSDIDTKLSQTNQVAGTILYASPEQVGGKSSLVDHQSDIYSLGVILYRVLAERLPHNGDTYIEAMFQILKKNPIPLSQIKKSIHPNLESICFKAIEKKKIFRYQQAIDLATDLELFQKGEQLKYAEVKRKKILDNSTLKHIFLAFGIFVGVCFFILVVNKNSNLQQELNTARQKLNTAQQELSIAREELRKNEKVDLNLTDLEREVAIIIRENIVDLLDDEEVLNEIGQQLEDKWENNNIPNLYSLLDKIHSLSLEVAFKKLEVENIKKESLLAKETLKELKILLNKTDLSKALEKIYWELGSVNKINNPKQALIYKLNAFNVGTINKQKRFCGELSKENLRDIIFFCQELDKESKLNSEQQNIFKEIIYCFNAVKK